LGFTKNCKELKDEGFILDNLEVLHNDYNPGLKGILEPDDDFIGTLIRTDGNEAIIHSNDGELSIPLDKLSIRKTGYNMGAYLSFRLGEEKWNSISALIKSKRHEILNNKKVHEDISKIAHSLFVEKDERGDYYFIQFRNKGEFSFSVNNRMLEVQNSINLKAPTFIFDFARTQTCPTADVGLKRYGPWDSQIFQPKSPTFLCIGHKDNRGYFTSFLRKLLDGIPNSQWYDSGLQKKYEFQRIAIDDRDIKSFEWDAYLDVIRSLEDTRPDLAIIEIPASFKFQKDQQNNPYYKIKAKLLKLEIPVQFITSENMRQATDVVLNSIALQIYAKLGGIPWVLPSNQTIDRELIIGVGHSWVRENAFKGAQQDRVVGLTTFMASDGQYLVSSKAKDVPFDEYFQELLNNLKSSIDKLERDLGWQPNDTIRLVFHIFKPIKNVEFDVIARLVSLYPQYRINFAFVTISKHNPFRLFDVSQPGTVRADQVKGKYVPGRGSNYKIDNYTAVVQMLGVREVKSPTHGVSNPMQIKIRLPEGRADTADIDRLIFTDLDYIVQQLYSFTYLSWRNFLPSEIPATMLYSTLIARLLCRLRKIEGWDPDSINFKLKQRKWFL